MRPESFTGRAVEILLVEDSPSDVELTREALETAKVKSRLHVVEDGVAATDFLFRRGRFAAAPEPDIVLLDLNLPTKDGREVLAEVKTNPDLAKIPIVVLSASQAEEDVLRAYQLHANCYIAKPVDFNQFLKIISLIEQFWLKLVQLPGNAH
jgi:two-component system, chemotaxis family, response regulator Rcp1